MPLLPPPQQKCNGTWVKISGPLLDRIDIHIEVTPVPFDKLSDDRRGEPSIDIRERVTRARKIQSERFF